jgi:hypothetical protein
MPEVGWRQPWGGEGVSSLPGAPMALTAPSARLTPRAEYPCATPPPQAQVAGHPLRPLMPREPAFEPWPTPPAGPGPPLPPALVARLHLRAEPLGDRLAPHRTRARPRLPPSVRHAEHVDGCRLPWATPLAPCTCPTPACKAARLVRGPCKVHPGDACPQGPQTRRGGGFVLDAAAALVPGPHADDLAPCVPTAPRRRPAGQDRGQGEGGEERTGAPPVRRPCPRWSPLPLLQPARLEPLAPRAAEALVPTPGRATLPQPAVLQRLIQAPDGGIASPGAVALCPAHRDRLPGLGRGASWAGARRASTTLGLVAGVEHRARRPLADVVFPRRRAAGASAPGGLRSGAPRARWGLVGAPRQAL